MENKMDNRTFQPCMHLLVCLCCVLGVRADKQAISGSDYNECEGEEKVDSWLRKLNESSLQRQEQPFRQRLHSTFFEFWLIAKFNLSYN